MTEEGGEKKEIESKRHTYALLRQSDMTEEMKTETMELCVTACEKFSTNYELASKMLKESLDKKFGGHWNVVIGESFGNSIGYHQKGLLYMFFGGNLIILVWKNT